MPSSCGLQAVPAARQLVAAADGGQQRLHGLVGGLVGEVARGQPVVEAAQPVVDGLVVQQRVEDERAGAQAGLERLRDGLGRGAPDVAVGGHEPREGGVERHRLVLVGQRDLERGDLLAEQPAPRAGAGDRLLGEDLLLGLGQQVRAVAARGAQEVARGVEAVGGHELLGAGVVDRGPLELEEDELRLDRRALLLHALHERADGRIGGVDAEAQHRVVAGARAELGDLLQLAHRCRERRRVELGDAAGVARRRRPARESRPRRGGGRRRRRPRRAQVVKGPRRRRRLSCPTDYFTQDAGTCADRLLRAAGRLRILRRATRSWDPPRARPLRCEAAPPRRQGAPSGCDQADRVLKAKPGLCVALC